MKKLVLGFFISFLFVSAISAQEDQTGKFSLAGNLNYGTKIESLGIGLRGQYGFMERLRGSLEYKYYIDRHNTSAWGLSADAHYLFGLGETFSIYPLAGVTFSRWTYDLGRSGLGELIEEFTDEKTKNSNNRIGLNIGLGGQIAVGEKTFIQVELKEALIKNYTQFVASVGFMYQF
ncbi:outer membrane protein X [Dysgonomonas sp. PFB1-18]|uniref:outer membrane beta-barrel protein n=1 Tax=unclassified Dysgonomonas TaxID=2630389 RepID=UPI0024769DD5|nr:MULTISPECIES: outer membrane beta-barrel protein [unclassified Dysgonomonas]MDH6307276.1 outer membrane protein X [Dysgonomonas sp. PF1-14]MDH6337194.1 outer membrane protein X [Dysgonomonas sp. PF1-16]MDH6379118.1 outer membrane protein X [Dysgonomonas sp. PFB1-18]MDH6396245.1 outer membrane protein X [Dysgonomonas sp. PF1-23]